VKKSKPKKTTAKKTSAKKATFGAAGGEQCCGNDPFAGGSAAASAAPGQGRGRAKGRKRWSGCGSHPSSWSMLAIEGAALAERSTRPWSVKKPRGWDATGVGWGCYGMATVTVCFAAPSMPAAAYGRTSTVGFAPAGMTHMA
jgi:hypothetical protein